MSSGRSDNGRPSNLDSHSLHALPEVEAVELRLEPLQAIVVHHRARRLSACLTNLDRRRQVDITLEDLERARLEHRDGQAVSVVHLHDPTPSFDSVTDRDCTGLFCQNLNGLRFVRCRFAFRLLHPETSLPAPLQRRDDTGDPSHPLTFQRRRVPSPLSLRNARRL